MDLQKVGAVGMFPRLIAFGGAQRGPGGGTAAAALGSLTVTESAVWSLLSDVAPTEGVVESVGEPQTSLPTSSGSPVPSCSASSSTAAPPPS